MKHTKLSLLLVIAVLCVFGLAVPTSAAQGASILSVTPNMANCTVDMVFQVQDAATYGVTLYDDGVLLAGADGTFRANQIVTARFTIGQQPGFPGVAFAVRPTFTDPSAYDFINDTYWTQAESDACADAGFVFGTSFPAEAASAGSCRDPLPAGAVVRNVPVGALAYFAPDPATGVNFTLPPGSWYIVRTDGDFAQVWIACQASRLWIPAANIAP